MTNTNTQDEIRKAVREQYGSIASRAGRDGQTSSGCCGPGPCGGSADASLKLGYSPDDLSSVPDGANMGLGCGNPHAIASLKSGETVVDLGAGGGFDCFLAARQVGPTGQVIGVDMTPEMVTAARANTSKVNANNVEFRLGEIEHLPVADATVDVILSNCVINLSPDKESVFREAFRVLKPGGRLAISDVVALKPLPAELVDEVTHMTGCVNSVSEDNFESMLRAAGFEDISVQVNESSREFVRDWVPESGIEDYVASATIEARKPAAACCGPTCCDDEASR